MLQETWLFSGSVKENIQMGFVQYNDEHILEVAKIIKNKNNFFLYVRMHQN